MNHLKSLAATISSILEIDITRKTRLRAYTEARYIYYKMAREMYGATYKAIGDSIDKDHSSVIHGELMANNLINVDKSFSEKYEMVRKYLVGVEEAHDARSYDEILSENELLNDKVNALSLQVKLLERQAEKYHVFGNILDRMNQQVPTRKILLFEEKLNRFMNGLHL
jgi:hypothetical protein